MYLRSKSMELYVVILGCVLFLFSLPVMIEGVWLDGLSGLWDPHTLFFGLLPLVLGLWCLRALRNLRDAGRAGDRLHPSEVSYSCGLASVALLIVLLMVALTIGPGPEVDFLGLHLLSSSILAALASMVFALVAKRSATQSLESKSKSRNWGLLISLLLIGCYSGVLAYNVWWHHRFNQYKTTERILIRNGLILELDRLAVGKYLAPGFNGELSQVLSIGRAPGESQLGPRDGWGRPLLYSCSADGSHYEMVSAGANGRIEARNGSEERDFGDDLDQDVVFADGEFRRFRWGSWCCSFILQEYSRGEIEDWLEQLD